MAIAKETWFEIRKGAIFEVAIEDVPSDLLKTRFPNFKDEKELTLLLATLPDLILNNLFVLQEDSEGKGGTDVLGVTEEGQLVVVETKSSIVNALALGQALGYAVYLDKEPKKLLPQILKFENHIAEKYLEIISRGTKVDEMPIVVVASKSISVTLMELFKYLGENMGEANFTILPMSYGCWKIPDSDICYVCRRIHEYEKEAPVRWNDWNVGDVAENMGTDTDCD
ncbi:MAG TPA: hypothetical protein PLQ76_00365, partial [bacterium]|nr:hypothetical protein [bacterium]